MEITVRLGSGINRPAGSSRFTVMLEEGATVTDLMDHLCTQYPEMADQFEKTVAIVSGNHVERDEFLSPGSEIAFLLPISGG